MRARLEKYDDVAVAAYERYVQKLQTEKDRKTDKLKNYWASKTSLDAWIAYFEKVAATGFFIDGENITIGNNGISLNYQAYKNLVIKNYPEAVFDVQLVKEGDDFSFEKVNGKITYSHEMKNPFTEKPFVGGYCIIKLRSGEYIETMSLAELEKIRGTAKTDYIWSKWTNEMYIKTLMKRACKRHFKDIVETLDSMDNQNYELPKDETSDTEIQTEINECKTTDDLTKLWNKIKSEKRTKAETTSIVDACAARKAIILGEQNENT